MWMWRVKPSIGWGPSTKSECGTSISSSSCCIHKHANQSSDQPKPNPTNQNPSNQTLTKWIFRKFKPVRSLWTRTETLGYQIMPKNTVTSKHDEKCTYMCERHRVRERRERERERESWYVHLTAEESSWSLVERDGPCDRWIWERDGGKNSEWVWEGKPSGLGKGGTVPRESGWEKRLGRGILWVFEEMGGYFGNKDGVRWVFVFETMIVWLSRTTETPTPALRSHVRVHWWWLFFFFFWYIWWWLYVIVF